MDMMRPPQEHRSALWAIVALLALHNLEEALTMPRYLPAVRARAPAPVARLAADVSPEGLRVALAVATLVPLAVVAWAWARPRSRAALWAALLVQATAALNVASHVVTAAVVLRGYAPGVATALALELPFSVWLFRRAARERWLARGALLALAPAAVVVHGPLLAGLLLLVARRWAGRG
jgi:hypothetical protein